MLRPYQKLGHCLERRLFVHNLSRNVNDEELKEMFINFGKITSAEVIKDESGRSRGFGFVEFEKKESATRAIHEMTNTIHYGKPLYLSRARAKPSLQTVITGIQQENSGKRMRRNRPNPPINPFMCLCGRRADTCIKERTEKQMIVDRLHAKIRLVQPQLAGYLTSILLQRMNSAGLLAMLSDQKVLMHMINAALVA